MAAGWDAGQDVFQHTEDSLDEIIGIVQEKLKHSYYTVLKAFQTFDRKDSGYILRSEALQAFRMFLYPLSEEQFSSILPRSKVERYGKVYYREFIEELSGLTACSGKHTKTPILRCPRNLTVDQMECLLESCVEKDLESVYKACMLYDYAHDGKIKKRELRRVLQNYCCEMSGEQFDAFWSRYDQDGTGMVSYEDFLTKLGINAGNLKE